MYYLYFVGFINQLIGVERIEAEEAMKNNIKLSIIVPIYNVEQYLERCLNSLVNQTIADDIEIICINDCSPDNCLNILKEYQEKYGNELIKIIDHKENTGVAISRNDGLEIAVGEYIGFVDPDDWVDLNFFEVLYKKSIETGADMVRGEVKEISDGIRKLEKCIIKTFDRNRGSVINSGFWSFIYKAKMLKLEKIIFPNLIYNEDVVFLAKSIISAKIIEIVSGVNYYYFQRQNSVTMEFTEAKALCVMQAMQMLTDFLNTTDVSSDLYVEFFNKFLSNLLEVFSFYKENQKMYYYNDTINNIFNLYDKCKYKLEYKAKYYEEYIDYIENKDSINFKKYLLNNRHFKKSFRIFKYFVILKIKHKENKKYFYLFNFIPILKIYKEKNFITHYKLFDLITLLTIKNN